MNIQTFPFGLEGIFSTEEACENEKTQAESMLGDYYQVKCEQTATKGTPLYWRIIGLVNTPEGQRVKLIKNDSIGNFGRGISASNVNYEGRVNEWSQSDLMKLLNPGYEKNTGQMCVPINEEPYFQCTEDTILNNSLYWDGGKGKCYNSMSNVVTDCDFTNNTLPDSLRQMIEEVTWNTGSNKNISDDFELLNVNKFYEYERSNLTGKVCNGGNRCNDAVDRTTSWKGKVGLMYPSDYGYATSGGETDNRKACLNTPVTSWYDYYNEENPALHPECYENDWLLPSEGFDWTISPLTDLEGSYYVFSVDSDGYVGGVDADYAGDVRPSIYLKPDVLVTLGNGSKETPFELEY